MIFKWAWGRGKSEGHLGGWTRRGGAGAVSTAHLETGGPCCGSPAGKSEGPAITFISVVQTGSAAAGYPGLSEATAIGHLAGGWGGVA